MTHATQPVPVRTAIPAAALAALLLAGCSSGHIGESWQCPLAEGGLCDSVAAADPAVPDTAAAKETALAEPLWRVRGGEPETQTSAPPCDADCDGGFDPFAWLAGLFESGDRVGAGGTTAPLVQAAEPSNTESGEEAVLPLAAQTEDPAAAALPAPGSRELVPASEPGGQAAVPARDEPADGPFDNDLRTGEIVARIWIAPFVDANGVYREAGHVRVVLAPAGWKLR